MIPRFANFRLANKYVRSSLPYAQCQSHLLIEEVRQKKSVGVLWKEFDNFRSSLQQINLIDYAHFCSKFSKSNELKLKSNSVVQQKKLYNLLKRNVLLRIQRESDF